LEVLTAYTMSLRGLPWVFLLLLLAAPGCGDDPPKTCGAGERAVTCKSDELCVTSVDVGGLHYQCAHNSCPNELDCSCAASACTAPFTCGEAKGDQVSCFCATC
jgi:hypothetical protein